MDHLTVIKHLKGLIVDGVHQAQSGHPGGALSSIDFTYILYAQSSSNSAQVSAYIYTGTYGQTNVSAGTAMTKDSLKIVGIAEVQNIADEGFTNSFSTNKTGAGLAD